jgi:hypothetical protein
MATDKVAVVPGDHKGSSAKVWIATITTLGVILAAAIPAYIAESKDGATHKYSGFVHSTVGDIPIHPAFISITSGQDAPLSTTTDSSGTFVIAVSKGAKSPILTVTAKGFVTEQRNVDLGRANPEPIYLTPVPVDPETAVEPGIKTGDINNDGTTVIGNRNSVAGQKKPQE